MIPRRRFRRCPILAFLGPFRRALVRAALAAVFCLAAGCVPLDPRGPGTDPLDRPIITFPDPPPDEPAGPPAPLLLPPRAGTLAEFLALPEADQDPGLGALLFAAEEYRGLPVEPFLRHLDALARAVRRRANAPPGPSWVDAINQVLYFDLGFKYDPDDPQGVLPENLYLNKVLERRKGYCVSLAVVYLALGRRLGLPLVGVRVPTHFIVRYDDGQTVRNIETTDYGLSHPDAYYEQKYRIAAESLANGVYLKNLKTRQVFADLYNNRGTLKGVHGDWRGALEALERGLAVDDASPFLHYNKGVILSRMGREDEALDAFASALALDPHNVFAVNNRAEIYANRGRHDDALAEVNRALAIFPEYSNGYLTRGVILQRMGKETVALENIDRALELDKRNAMAYVFRARIRRDKGELARALHDLNRAVASDPAEAQAWAERGFTHMAMDRPAKALEDFEQAVALAPMVPEYRINRGILKLKARDLAAARADFDAAVALAPNKPEPLLKRAALALLERRPAEALADLDRAVVLAPDHPGVLLKRGVALAALGRDRDAESDLLRSAHIAPDTAEVHKQLGFLYARTGETEKVPVHLKRFLALENGSDAEGRARAEDLLRR